MCPAEQGIPALAARRLLFEGTQGGPERLQTPAETRYEVPTRARETRFLVHRVRHLLARTMRGTLGPNFRE